ncbi:MAG TPA: S41 family peptidase [Candidatus Limnocylindria bacterium]|nr:S41 family peptidase [Candidatus Limnocylindria bacterium]
MTRLIIALAAALLGSRSLAQPNDPRQPAKEAPVVVTPEMTGQLIARLRTVLVDNYIFPDTAADMVALVEKEYEKGAYANIRDPGQLADRLQNDLQAAHHDGHLRFMYDPGFRPRPAGPGDGARPGKPNDERALADQRQNNFLFHRVEVLNGNIGYVAFSGFTELVEQARPTFTAAFRFVAHTRALIIDLRNNGGGSPRMVNQVESYFFPEKTHMNDIVDRNSRTNTFWTDPALAEGVLLDMPVYILTSRQTFSGAEDFAYGMQAIKRAIVVGDPTGGGAHPTGTYEVGLGFAANIPNLRSLNPYTDKDWEGTGVIPDLPVPAADALVAARRDILTRQLASATNDREKKQIQWAMNLLLAPPPGETIEPAQLAAYAGHFRGGLRFYVKGQDLYCQNAQRGNVEAKLQHLARDLFALDDKIQVEFKKDQSGQISGLQWYRADGTDSFKEKESAR